MTFDAELAERARQTLRALAEHEEKKMFGGLCFLVGGHMTCGVVRNDLMVRVGPSGHEAALARRRARPMDFTGRPLRGMVYVSGEGLEGNELEGWLSTALSFVRSLPPKEEKAPRVRAPRGRRKPAR